MILKWGGALTPLAPQPVRVLAEAGADEERAPPSACRVLDGGAAVELVVAA